MRSILTRKCVVYGNALSLSSMLFLARQHNDYNQIQRVTSFPEVAACCRRLLFAHFGENLVEEESVCLDIPRYNSQPYREYKEECVSFIASSQIVSPTLHTVVLRFTSDICTKVVLSMHAIFRAVSR